VRRPVLAALVGLVLLYHISGYVGDEMATTTMSVAMAVVEQGTVVLDDYKEGARELSYRNGHFYSGMPPGQSFVAVPLYLILRPAIGWTAERLGPIIHTMPMARKYELHHAHAVRRLLLLVLFQALVVVPCGAVGCVMVCDLASALGIRLDRPAPLLLPLGTIWWAYGGGSGARVMGAVLLLLPIWYLLAVRREGEAAPGPLMAACLGAGLVLAALIRYDLALPAVAVAAWALWRIGRRGALALAAAALVAAALGSAYHAHCYGGPLKTAYSSKLYTASRLLKETGCSPEGLPTVEYDGDTYVVFNQGRRLGFTPATVLSGLLTHREALLRFSPFVLLAPWGLWLLLAEGGRRREVALLIAALGAINLLILALMPHPGFRGAVGPRYLLWSLPLAVVAVVPAWLRLPAWLRGTLFAASFVPSYLAAMFTAYTDGAWNVGRVLEYGLSNYTLSRMQQAGVVVTPIIATILTLVFWAVIAALFLRPASRWYLYGGGREAETAGES